MKLNVKKLALAGMMTALGVCLSAFSIPVGASKCFPVQHLLNVLAGVFLGPGYALGFSFSTALIRNLLGTGSLLAFPGSMAGAFLCALLYRYTKKIWTAFAGDHRHRNFRCDVVLPAGTIIDGKSTGCTIYLYYSFFD